MNKRHFLPSLNHNKVADTIEVSEIDDISQIYQQFKELAKREHQLLLEIEKITQKKQEHYHFLISKKRGLAELQKKTNLEGSLKPETDLKLIELRAFIEPGRNYVEQLLFEKEIKDFVSSSNSNLKRILDPLPSTIINLGNPTSCHLNISGPTKCGSTQAHFVNKVEGMERPHGNDVTAKTITTFPSSVLNPHYHELSITDHYKIRMFHDRSIFCLTKGSGWGERSASASKLANHTFISCLEQKLWMTPDTISALYHLVLSLYKANQVLSQTENSRCICFGGLLSPITKYDRDGYYALTYLNIGNTMAFHYSISTQSWSHITSRNAAKDSDDELIYGIGKLDKLSGPDLSTLDLGVVYLEKKRFNICLYRWSI